jgi:uncharacterized protein YqeY
MSLKERINEEMKASMKSGDKVRLETVRSIRALILEFEKSGADRELNQDDEMKMLNSAVKKRKEAMEQYRAAGREELAAKEEAELNILLEFLPMQLSEAEIEAEVKKLAVELNASGKEHFSVLMPAAAKALKGKADGKIIRGIVEKLLGGN